VRDRDVVEVANGEARVVAFLGLNSGAQRRSYVAGQLWPEVSEQRARANLRNAVWKVHAALPGLLDPGPDTIGLASSVHVDIAEVRVAADMVLRGDGSSNPLPYAQLFSEELLAGWDDDWVLFERERLKQLCLHALEDFSDHCADAGAFAAAIDSALLAVKLEPLRESAHRAVSRAHLLEGNVVQARRQYETYSHLLWDELGIAPSEAYSKLVSFNCTTASPVAS